MVGAPLHRLAFLLQFGHGMPMFGSHLPARRGDFLGKRPPLAGKLLAEMPGFRLGLGEPRLRLVKLFLPHRQCRGHAIRLLFLSWRYGGCGQAFLLSGFRCCQSRQPPLHLPLLYEQFLLVPGQFFATAGQIVLAFIEPETDSPRLRLQFGDPGVHFGLAMIQLLLPTAKMRGQLIGLETNLFGGRLIHHRLCSWPLPSCGQIQDGMPRFVGAINPLCSAQVGPLSGRGCL